MKRDKRSGFGSGIALAMLALCAAMSMQASADWSTEVYTNFANGVEWSYKIDEDAKTAYLVKNSEGTIVSKSMTGVLYIPAAIVHDGTSYSVTKFDALAGCSKLTGVVFPETTQAQIAAGYTFQSMSSLVALWFKGPETVSSGTQPVATIAIGLTQVFKSDSATRVVLLGPNVDRGGGNSLNYPMFKYSTGYVRLFFPAAIWPANGTAACRYFSSNSQGKLIRYGPGTDIDISIDGVFTVANTNRLDDVLEVANDLHDYCGLTPRIAVTNTIEFAEGLITEDRVKNVVFESLTFSAKTQTELDAILAAMPDGIHYGIDPTGATEDLLIPAANAGSISLKLPPGYKYKIKPDGTIFIVR